MELLVNSIDVVCLYTLHTKGLLKSCVGSIIDYKHILAALIDSEQMLSIEAQLCTCKECKTFQPRRPSSVAMHKVRVRHCPTYIVT